MSKLCLDYTLNSHSKLTLQTHSHLNGWRSSAARDYITFPPNFSFNYPAKLPLDFELVMINNLSLKCGSVRRLMV